MSTVCGNNAIITLGVKWSNDIQPQSDRPFAQPLSWKHDSVSSCDVVQPALLLMISTAKPGIIISPPSLLLFSHTFPEPLSFLNLKCKFMARHQLQSSQSWNSQATSSASTDISCSASSLWHYWKGDHFILSWNRHLMLGDKVSSYISTLCRQNICQRNAFTVWQS